MILFGVNPDKQRSLEQRFERLDIREQDIVEKFVRSQGKGGQNVNKTATCVYLRHLPTGIEVKAQQDRSQAVNRFLARRLLADKVESLILGRQSQEQQRIEKLRRQKRKRSKRAKEKMLASKRLQAAKKISRAPVSSGE
jgi:protein subunit release factor B